MADERRYNEQEVRAILERALRQDKADGSSHSDLLDAAREVGISTSAVEQAALEVEQGRELELARQRVISRRRSGFTSHLVAFIAVNVFLLAINLITSPGHLWSVFPLLGWGLGMVFSARAGLSKEVSERALLRELARSSAGPRRVALVGQPSRGVGRLDLGEAATAGEPDETAGRERKRRRR
jgi:hypothetical protein